jgi:predicted dehydrogenase
MLRWGLIAPGRIARQFADAMRFLPDQRLHRVAGRDAGRARAFAQQWGGQAHDSIEALCADPEVDIAYIASPHSAHAEQAALALRAGKPVLCEKALTRNAAEAEALIALAREQKLFLMEAVWTRFLPAWQRVRELLQARAIGRVQRVQSSFCFHAPYDPASRLFDPALAGGALLDIGIYNLNLTSWVMQAAGQGGLLDFEVDGVLAPTGVEQRAEGRLRFEGGATAGFTCAFDGRSDNAMHIEASDGWMVLDEGFSRARSLRWQGADGVVHHEQVPPDGNGFEGQMRACAEALQQGWLEHPTMPHADSLAVLRLIDAMKARLGAQ